MNELIDLVHEFTYKPGVTQEIINGLWFVLGMETAIFLLLYVVRSFMEHGRGAINRDAVKIALALIIFTIGSSTRSLWVWFLWECRNRTGTACPDYFATSALLIFSASMATIGLLLIIKNITKQQGHYMWIVAGLVAIAAPITLHLMR